MAAMLTRARDRAVAANVPVEFLQDDMRQFDLGRQFSLIVVARNSLLHLLRTEDLLATFATIRRHLGPGGVFAFDVFNRSAAAARDRYVCLKSRTPDLKEIS